MRVRAGWHAIAILLFAVATLEPRVGHADDRTVTLRRAVGNVLLGPFDVALSPAVTAKGLYENATEANYSPGAIAALELLGGAGWYFPVTAGTSALRILAGFLEMPVGAILLVSKSFTAWEPDPFFQVVDKPAIVSFPNAPIPIVFGVNYLAGR